MLLASLGRIDIIDDALQYDGKSRESIVCADCSIFWWWPTIALEWVMTGPSFELVCCDFGRKQAGTLKSACGAARWGRPAYTSMSSSRKNTGRPRDAAACLSMMYDCQNTRRRVSICPYVTSLVLHMTAAFLCRPRSTTILVADPTSCQQCSILPEPLSRLLSNRSACTVVTSER